MSGRGDSFDFRRDTNVSWKRDDLGGRSTPIVMHGKLYTLVRAEPETPQEGEKVVCLDAKTGETIWENRFNVWLSDVPDTRVGWSSVVGDPETGRVYALGVCGFFQCLDGDTGKRIWSVPLHEKYGLLSTYGGRTNFPVLCLNYTARETSRIKGSTHARQCRRPFLPDIGKLHCRGLAPRMPIKAAFPD